MNSFEQYKEEERKKLEETEKKQKDTINQGYDEQAKIKKDIYNTAVKNTEIGYESKYERNAVQKLINEKAIAEKNANLGLTDSGLNRTQQTAAQLSYANQKGALDIAKQGALDELTQDLAISLSNIEQGRRTDLANLEANIEAQAHDNAIDRYNADIEARSKMYSSSAGSSGGGSYSRDEQEDVFLWYYTDTFDENGNPIFSNSNGERESFGKGVNPYTGANNIKTYAEEYKNTEIGFFSNGYQPRGLVSEGGAFERATNDNGEYLYTNITGKKQTIWKSPSGKYFVWFGDQNQYVEVTP